MKLLSRVVVFLVSALLMTACAFAPAVKSPGITQSACSFYTPEWTLSVQQIDDGSFCREAHDDLDVCLLTVGVIIPVGSLLVSGSVVLIGNTLHWLEYQGTCADSEVHQKLRSLREDVGVLHLEVPGITIEAQGTA